MRRMASLIAPLAFTAGACGGSKEEPKAPEPVHEEAKATPPEAPLAVAQELGSIDPDQVKRTWDRLQPDIDACRKRGQERIEYLHGDVKLFVRVGGDGAVKWTFFEDSNLGDRDTEKCILDVIARAPWPKPIGGDAEVRTSLGFDPDGRPPASWSPDKIAALLGKNDKDLHKCKAGARATFHVTLYVEPNKKDGKVQAVGVAVPMKGADEKIDCIVKEVMGWKMPSPGSWGAKVDFRI